MNVSPPKPVRSDADIVEQVVRAYLQRSKWARTIPDDLRQEAHAAIAVARRSFSIEKGEWNGYAYRAAWLALASFVVAESSPVTRREKGAPNTARRVSDAFLMLGSGYEPPTPGARPLSRVDTFGVSSDDVEKVVGDKEWDAVVRERVLVVCRGDPDLVRILMEETTPAEVATARGVPVSRIYNAAAGARARLSGDLELYSLMCAKNGVQSEESGGERE